MAWQPVRNKTDTTKTIRIAVEQIDGLVLVSFLRPTEEQKPAKMLAYMTLINAAEGSDEALATLDEDGSPRASPTATALGFVSKFTLKMRAIISRYQGCTLFRINSNRAVDSQSKTPGVFEDRVLKIAREFGEHTPNRQPHYC